MTRDSNKEEFTTIEKGSPQADVLRTPAVQVQFPLSEDDKRDIELLRRRFCATENCTGLAAPQIGIGKQIIIYHVDESVKQWRDDVHELVPTRVLINPSYKNLNDHKTIDWEACFSVESQYGEVPRFTNIEYAGFDEQGKLITGVATGFHARVLQHEIGHLNKELFFDLFSEGCRHGDYESMRALRLKELEEKRKNSKS